MTELDLIHIFGDNLVGILEDQGMSQKELAQAAELSPGTISKYINKQQMPTVKALINIAYVLEVEPSELMPLYYFID